MNPTLGALTGFVGWTLLLLFIMEGRRTQLVLTKAVPANGFVPDNANLSPFMQRLARAHANCLEGIPLFGGLMIICLLAGKPSISDPLAYVLLGARIVQSTIHLASTSQLAVSARFTAFSVQMFIALYWTVRLLAAVVSGH